MAPALLLLALVALEPVASARRRDRMPFIVQTRSDPAGPSSADCNWKFYPQPLSHFAEGSTVAGNATFQQRVCVIDKYWAAPSPELSAGRGDAATGPILFYTGNESPVEVYINNTGLMWSLAPKLNALMIFAEHRYEGESFPDLVGMPNCMSYCTSAEALADFATLITTMKAELKAETSPVVAFGGSYGGMLSSWFRIKYPNIIDGAIAASAPIWGFPLTYPQPDGFAVAITRGVSTAGGATDFCRDNLAAAWPLIRETGRTAAGREMLSRAFKTCAPLKTFEEAESLLDIGQEPWFDMAEGDYPFPSTYITFSVGPNSVGNPGLVPLPAWPMRAACAKGLDTDFGVKYAGNRSAVQYTVSLGDFVVEVDWNETKTIASHASATGSAPRDSALFDLVRGVSEAVGVWFNLTGKMSCFDHVELARQLDEPSQVTGEKASPKHEPEAAAAAGPKVCGASYAHHSKTESWGGVTCNEHLRLVNTNVKGVGRDFFWPPNVPRDWTFEKLIDGNGDHRGCTDSAQHKCRAGADDPSGYPADSDPWSRWLDDYYGGLKLGAASNIVFSNGLLDPWSSGGVTKNISSSVVAVVLDLGAHHLDLMFPHPDDPPCAKMARDIEEQHIRKWITEAYAYRSSLH